MGVGEYGSRQSHPRTPTLPHPHTTASTAPWSVKQLHRLILTSATWRQSAFHPRAREFQQLDPAESLLWRSRIRRLTAEQIRDAMLAVTGELDETVGGASVELSTPRRSLYVKTFRNAPPEFLCDFDVANGLKSVPERNRTTTPIQSLLMINGEFAIERGERLAKRLLRAYSSSDDAAIDTAADESAATMLAYAFRMTWGREPTDAELTKALDFVDAIPADPPSAVDPDKLSDFCHVLLNSNEFLYID